MKKLPFGSLLYFAFATPIFANPLQSHLPGISLTPATQAQTSQTKTTSPDLDIDTKRLNADTVIKSIQTLRKKNELKKARTLAIKYLKNHPDNVDVILLLGLIYKQAGAYNQAKVLLNLVLEEVPTYTDARIGLVNILINEKKYDDALTLINAGLNLTPSHHKLQTLRTRIITLQSSQTQKEKIYSQPQDILNKVKELRKNNQLNKAVQVAQNHLDKNPGNVDIQLMLGLIYRQLKQYTKAELLLDKVLKKVPTYTDARIGLIHIKLAKNKKQEALKLMNEGLSLTPDDKRLQQLQKDIKRQTSRKTQAIVKENPLLMNAKLKLQDKNYQDAQILLHAILKKNSLDNDARILLANTYLAQHNDMKALFTINQGLSYQPKDIELLIKKGQIQSTLRQYALAIVTYQRAQTLDPENKAIKGLITEIESISPYYRYGINEIGLSTQNSYVSDLKSWWDYSNLFYARDTPYGRIKAQINYASRMQNQAPQYELQLSPRLNRNIYFDLNAAYANQLILFPQYRYGAEGFFNIPDWFELSLGAKYSDLDKTYFSTYTGSLNFYKNQYWLSIRPYYFQPKDRSKNSILYTGTLRKYWGTTDHYINVNVGSGRSPDLADLITVNFLVIKNNFINTAYQFPLFNHKLIVDLGMGYQRWQYPSGLNRNLYNTRLGIKHRF